MSRSQHSNASELVPSGGTGCRARRVAERARADAGFTLIELLVAAAVLAVVLTAVLSLLDRSNVTAANDAERNVSLNEETNALHRMTQELRQAYQVLYPTSGATTNKFDMLVRLTRNGTSTELRVIYDCSNTVLSTGMQQCVRYEGPASNLSTPGTPPAGFSQQVVVPRLLNGTASDPVFSGLTNPNDSNWATDGNGPSYTQVTIKTPSKGERTIGSASTIQLNDSVYMPNTDEAH